MEDNNNSPESNPTPPESKLATKPQKKKAKPKPVEKQTNFFPLFLILVFGAAIFFLLKQFNASQSLINLFLINVIAIFVGYCCWYFIGQIQGNEFEVFGFKIKTITGSFFVWLFVFVMGIVFFNPSPKTVIVQDDKIIKGLADYAGLDLKIKIEPTSSGRPFYLDNLVDVSKYISSISASPPDTKQKLDLTFQLPDSIATSTSQIFLTVNEYTYQRMLNPNAKTEPLTHITSWGEFKEENTYVFKHPFQTSIPISIILWK